MFGSKDLCTVDVIAALEDGSGPLDPLKIAMAVNMREGESWRRIIQAGNVTVYVLDPDLRGIVVCEDGLEGYRRCQRFDAHGLSVTTVEATRPGAALNTPRQPDNERVLDRVGSVVDRVLAAATGPYEL